jgi:hypothetical protein
MNEVATVLALMLKQTLIFDLKDKKFFGIFESLHYINFLKTKHFISDEFEMPLWFIFGKRMVKI